MNSVVVDFLVQAVAGVFSVFLGVWLALITDRSRRAREEAAHEQERTQEFERARHTVLGSVVKNTAEAKRLSGKVARRTGCQLIHTGFETSVWDAVRTQFMQACHGIDERVLFAQFFDGVRRLQAFFEFHRDLQLSIAGAPDSNDPELAEIGRDADQRLRELADDLRFNGVLLITDYGEPVHQRLLGLKPATGTQANESMATPE